MLGGLIEWHTRRTHHHNSRKGKGRPGWGWGEDLADPADPAPFFEFYGQASSVVGTHWGVARGQPVVGWRRRWWGWRMSHGWMDESCRRRCGTGVGEGERERWWLALLWEGTRWWLALPGTVPVERAPVRSRAGRVVAFSAAAPVAVLDRVRFAGGLHQRCVYI